MPRSLLLAALTAALAAAGCRSFDENAGLFPRLRDRIDPDADHRMEDYRLTRMPPAQQPTPAPAYATSGGCVPCGGGGYTSPMYAGGMTVGMPAVTGGGYGYTTPVVSGGYTTPVVSGGYSMPTGYSTVPGYSFVPGNSGVPSYTTGPVLGSPVYPSGDSIPYRPRRDDELPPPGGYSTPGAAEMGRNVAPKPFTSLPVGK